MLRQRRQNTPLLLLLAMTLLAPAARAQLGQVAEEGDPSRSGLAVPSEESWGDEWADDVETPPRQEPLRAIPAPPPTPEPEPQPERVAPAAAEPPSREEAPPLKPPSERFSDLEARWTERRIALVRRDGVEIAAQEERFAELLRTLDIPEADAFAAAAVRESWQLTFSDPKLALVRARLAVSLAPSMPATHLAETAARFAADPWDLLGWGSSGLNALLAAVRSERHLRPLLADFGGSLAVAWAVGGASCLLLLLLRHGRHALHDFHHFFPKWTARIQTSVLALLILALPLAVGLGPFFLAALMGIGLSVYLGRAERIVVALWLISMGLLPIGAGWLSARTAWSGTTAELLDRIDRGGDFAHLPELDARIMKSDATPEEIFALARVRKREGGWTEAVQLYERALALRPGWAPAEVNLGNIRFLQGDLAAAEKHYKRAIASDPELAAPWFGLSRMHYRRVDFEKGQQAREKALFLDRSLVGRYAQGEEEVADANRYLLDARLGDHDLSALAVRPGETKGVATQVAMKLFHSGVPAVISPWIALAAALAMIGLHAGRSRISPSRACGRCGRPACVRCDPETRGQRECGQCLHVFSKRSRVDPAARLRKELAVRRYRSRRRLGLRLSAFFLAAPTLAGHAAKGAMIVTGWAFLAALLAFGDGILRRTFEVDLTPLRLALQTPLWLGLYLIGLRVGLRSGD